MKGAPVSVVIPAFQAGQYIGDAIASVLDQDVPAGEVIVVDDGSTDNTRQIVAGFGERVQLIRQPNGGEAAARNTGLDAATHDWVMFLDADDEFLPGRVRAVISAIAQADPPDVVTTDADLRCDGVTIRRCYTSDWPFAHTDQRSEILRRNFVFGHVAVRRAALIDLGGFDPTIGHAADWDMWIRVILAGGRIGLVPEVLSVYRLHAHSMSADRVGIELGCLASLTKALEHPSLGASEKLIVGASVREHQSLLVRARLNACLESGSGVRRAALAVTRSGESPLRSRATAFAAAFAPRIAQRALRRRRRGLVIGTTGRLVAAGDDASVRTAPRASARTHLRRGRSG